MNTIRPIRLPAAWLVPIVTAIALSACAHKSADPHALPDAPIPHFPAARLAQIGYGDQADFVLCIPPHCPTCTPKTVGAAPAPSRPQVQAAAEPIESAESTPDAGQALPDVEPPSDDAATSAAEVQTWSIGFAFGSVRLDAVGLRTLEQIAAVLPVNRCIMIAGRTDNAGPAAVNQTLAHARAQTVRDHLVRLRPELKDVITVEATGNCCFVASNDTAAGRSRNRRVEITLQTQFAPP
jgi:outer membrane protein OmpA-like peptidoglycan-associated protein